MKALLKRVEQPDEIDGLILPGGESTTLRRLMDLYGFKETTIRFANVWNMCWINCSCKNVENESGYLNKLDITVERNSFRQVDSFESELDIKGIANDIEEYLLEHLILLKWITEWKYLVKLEVK